MSTFFKFGFSYYKIDLAAGYYEQVNQAPDSTSFAKVTNNTAVTGLNNASIANANQKFEAITEVQYNEVKNQVKTTLNSL